MKARPIVITTIATAIALSTGQTQAAENVFVRGKDKFLEVTEKPKNVVKGVGKDIGFGFRDAWKRVSSFVTGKEPEPEFPVYDPAPYTPPPYGYTSPQGTNYAPGYGPPVNYRPQQPRRNPAPYSVPAPPYPQQSPTVRQVPPPQTPPVQPRTLTKPKTTPPISQPKPKVKPTPKVEPKIITPPPTKPKPKTNPTPPPPVLDDQPQFAVPIPGKSGMVYSPFTKDKKPVDVRDIPAGTVVKDPYTNKLFRVP